MTTAETFQAGARVRGDGRLMRVPSGTVLGPVAGDPSRVWVLWDAPVETWAAGTRAKTTARVDWLEMVE